MAQVKMFSVTEEEYSYGAFGWSSDFTAPRISTDKARVDKFVVDEVKRRKLFPKDSYDTFQDWLDELADDDKELTVDLILDVELADEKRKDDDEFGYIKFSVCNCVSLD